MGVEQWKLDLQELTTRGLERHTAKGMVKYFENHRKAMLAVTRAKNDREIAQAYRSECEHTQHMAVLQAKKDAKEAEKYFTGCDYENVVKIQKKRQDEKKLVKRILKPLKSLSKRSVVSSIA